MSDALTLPSDVYTEFLIKLKEKEESITIKGEDELSRNPDEILFQRIQSTPITVPYTYRKDKHVRKSCA